MLAVSVRAHTLLLWKEVTPYLYRINIKLLHNQPVGCLSLPSDSMESCVTVTTLGKPKSYQPFILKLYGLLTDSTSSRVIYDVFNSWQEWNWLDCKSVGFLWGPRGLTGVTTLLSMATYHVLPHTASVVRMLNGQSFISGRGCILSFKQVSSEVQQVFNLTKN
jgi:hypothetical protein